MARRTPPVFRYLQDCGIHKKGETIRLDPSFGNELKQKGIVEIVANGIDHNPENKTQSRKPRNPKTKPRNPKTKPRNPKTK